MTAYSTNPRLRARPPRAQETYLEEVLGEVVSARMLTKDADPVAFVVPNGCNAVDFYLGSVEINPAHGKAEDLDEVITVGDLVITGTDHPLNAGDQIAVVVPWRHASWVEMAQGHLRLPIYARFYQQSNS